MSILDSLNKIYTIELKDRPATLEEISQLQKFSHINLPFDYINFLKQATNVELSTLNGLIIRIWGITGTSGVIELNEAYHVQQYIPNSLVIGDDGGDMALLFLDNRDGVGLYLAEFGDLDVESAVKLAPTLSDFLVNNVGVENLL